MTSYSDSPGLDRKALKQPDEFMSKTQAFFQSIVKNFRAVLAIIVLFLVLGAAAAFFMGKKDAQSDTARNAKFLADKTFETELKALAGANVPPLKEGEKAKAAVPSAEALEFKPMDVDAQLPKTVAQYRAVIQDFSGSRAAQEARVSLAALYFHHGQIDKALPLYENAVSSAQGSFDKATSTMAVGYCQEDLGKYSEAVQTFQKAINLGESAIKGDALLAMARSYEKLKDNAKAKATYDQVITQLPNSEYAKSAEQLKSAVE